MKIVKKEEIYYDGDVFNLHVENDHNYIVYPGIVASNCHSAKGKQLAQILDLCTNAHTRLGVTGTTDGSELMQLQLEGLFGTLYHVITTKELMDRGAVAQMDIKCLMLTYPEEVKKLCKDMKYQEEVDYLVTNPKRLKFTANLAANLKGNTLILINFIEKHGQPLYDLILSKTSDDRKVFFIHGDVDGEERNDIRAIVDNTKVGIEMWFNDKSIMLNNGDLVKLTNGEYKKAENITDDDDVDDEWITENTKN